MGATVAAPPTITAHALDATTSFAYDKLGRLVSSTDAEGGIELFDYDAFGQRKAMRNKIGGWTDFIYDARGLLTEEKIWFTAKDAQSVSFAVNTFTYDSRGNLTTKTEAGVRTTVNVHES